MNTSVKEEKLIVLENQNNVPVKVDKLQLLENK
jgi:hypothetical protein